MGAGLAIVCIACKTSAPPRPAPARAPEQTPSRNPAPPLPSFAPQPANRLADVNGIAVLALAAPQFASLARDQRLVAHFAAQAAAAGDPIAAEQGYRHNLTIIRLLRGILTRPQVVPAALLGRIRAFARLVYLNHGLHDAETGRKQRPGFRYRPSIASRPIRNSAAPRRCGRRCWPISTTRPHRETPIRRSGRPLP